MQKSKPTGMRAFTIIWFGQLLSLVGTAMTRFALLVWAYEESGTATSVALIGFAAVLPIVVISPIAGIVVDRYDRRLVMLLTDLGAGIATILIFMLHLTGNLVVWHSYLLVGLMGFFEAFQSPAYTAASTMLIPRQHYSRANGMRSVAEMGAQLFAPFAAAALLPVAGLGGVMLVDVVTFLIAVATLSAVTIPAPPPDEGDDAFAGLRQQMQVGFRFIFARGGLVGLMAVMMAMNFADGLTYSSVLPVMILAKTGGSEWALAWVQIALGIGGVIGGVLTSVFGAPRRLIHGVLFFAALSFAFGDGQLGLGDSVWQWSLGAFTASIFIPTISAAQLTIWQQKTPPGVQGRVFAVKNMLQIGTRPIGFLLAGPLADGVFEPAMTSGGALADVFGGWVGTGAGSGVALMFLFTAAFGCLFSLGGYLFPAIRNVERDLPDYEVVTESVPAAV